MQRDRLNKAGRRLGRIRLLTKAKKECRVLIRTGAIPQGTWGHEAQGAGPSTVRTLRAQVGWASCARRTGGCATTALRLHGIADPAIDMPLQQLTTWVKLLHLNPQLTVAAERSWKLKQQVFDTVGKRHWHHVHGPMSATMAVLKDIGWSSRGPTTWIDSRGKTLQLQLNEPHVTATLVDRARTHLEKRCWATASKHQDGKGLEHGADLTTAKKHHAHLQRKSLIREAGCLDMVLQGAVWTTARRHQAGYADSPACPSRPNGG